MYGSGPQGNVCLNQLHCKTRLRVGFIYLYTRLRLTSNVSYKITWYHMSPFHKITPLFFLSNFFSNMGFPPRIPLIRFLLYGAWQYFRSGDLLWGCAPVISPLPRVCPRHDSPKTQHPSVSNYYQVYGLRIRSLHWIIFFLKLACYLQPTT